MSENLWRLNLPIIKRSLRTPRYILLFFSFFDLSCMWFFMFQSEHAFSGHITNNSYNPEFRHSVYYVVFQTIDCE